MAEIRTGKGHEVAQFLALLAAVSFALAAVLQQKGTLQSEAGENDPHFLVEMLSKPAWLAGAGFLVSAWVLQVAALDRGSLMVVQVIISLNLVIALPFGIWLTGQVVRGREWLGAAATVFGIVVFLSVGSPSAGSTTVGATTWWVSGLVTAALVTTGAVVGFRRHGPSKAALLGAAAGVAYAFQACVTKEFTAVISGGLDAVLHSWTTYVLIASALIGGVLQQTALKSGVLAPAISSTSAVALFGSVVFGAAVFGERLAHGGGKFAPAVIGLVVAMGGIVVLAGSKEAPPAEVAPS